MTLIVPPWSGTRTSSSTGGCCGCRRHPWYTCCSILCLFLLCTGLTLYFLFFDHKPLQSSPNILLVNDRMKDRYDLLSSAASLDDPIPFLSSTMPSSSTVVPYLVPLPYQAHSFNDVDNWFSLILKGIQWFKVDISLCLRDSCLTYSTFNTLARGNLQECVDIRVNPTLVETYCCLCLRGDTSSRPSLVTPFSTGWDMVKFFDNEAYQSLFQNLPHSLYFGLNFGGTYGGLQRDISASMIRTWLTALAQVKNDRKLSKIVFYFDNQLNEWYRELDTVCSSVAGCSTNDRSFLDLFSSSDWPSEFPLPFPALSMDPLQRIQILNMDWNLLASYCGSSSTTTGTSSDESLSLPSVTWNTPEMYQRTAKYPYLFWAISSQHEVCSVWDRLNTCEPLLSFIQQKNIFTNSYRTLYKTSIENNIRLVSNQNPEMFEIMSASRLMYRGMNHPLDPSVAMSNPTPSSSPWTNPFLLLVPTLIKQYDNLAILVLRHRYRPLHYTIRVLGYVHNVSPTMDKNLLYEIAIPIDNRTTDFLPSDMQTIVSVQLVQYSDIVQDEDMDIRIPFAVMFRTGRMIIYQINRATGKIVPLWSRCLSVIEENYARLRLTEGNMASKTENNLSFGLLSGTILCTGKSSPFFASHCYVVAIIGENFDNDYSIQVYPLFFRNNNNNDHSPPEYTNPGVPTAILTSFGSGVETVDEDSTQDEELLSLMTRTEAIPIFSSSVVNKQTLPFRIPVDEGMALAIVQDITRGTGTNTLYFTGLLIYSRHTILPDLANEGIFPTDSTIVSSKEIFTNPEDNLNRVFIVDADSTVAETIANNFYVESKMSPLPSNAPPRQIFPSLQNDLQARSEVYGTTIDVSFQYTENTAPYPVVRMDSFTPLYTGSNDPIRIGFGARPQLSLRIHEGNYTMVLLVVTHSDCDGGLYLNNGNINKCQILYPSSDNDPLYTPLQSVPYLLTYSYGMLDHWKTLLRNNDRYRSTDYISTLNMQDQNYWYNQLVLNNCNHRIMHGKLETGSFVSAVLYPVNTLQYIRSDGTGEESTDGGSMVIIPEIGVLAIHDGVIGNPRSTTKDTVDQSTTKEEPDESILTAFYCAPTEPKPYLVWDSWRLVQPSTLESIEI